MIHSAGLPPVDCATAFPPAVVSAPYDVANSLCAKAGPHASLGCTWGSHWLQSGSCKAMRISRGLRLASGRNTSGLICPTSSRRLGAFPGGFEATRLPKRPTGLRKEYRGGWSGRSILPATNSGQALRIYFLAAITGTVCIWPVWASCSLSAFVSGAKITDLPMPGKFRERTVRSFP